MRKVAHVQMGVIAERWNIMCDGLRRVGNERHAGLGLRPSGSGSPCRLPLPLPDPLPEPRYRAGGPPNGDASRTRLLLSA
jgi:hypothetical protein